MVWRNEVDPLMQANRIKVQEFINHFIKVQMNLKSVGLDDNSIILPTKHLLKNIWKSYAGQPSNNYNQVVLKLNNSNSFY